MELVKQIRPSRATNYKEAELKFKALLYQLLSDKKALFSLRKALLSEFLSSNFVPALTESGMLGSRGFLQELIKKVKHRILPPLLEPENLLYVVNHVFYRKDDNIWVEKIDRDFWIDFFNLLGIQISVTNEKILRQLNESLHLLIQRTVTLGLEKEIMGNYLKINYQEYSFFLLDVAVQDYLLLYNKKAPQSEILNAVTKVVDGIKKCRQTIDNVSEQRKKNGTSLSQTYILIRLEQHLERLLVITDVLDSDHHFNAERLLYYFIRVITYEKKKNSIGEFLSANLSFLAFKITEHGGRRGKKYITSTREDYWSMLKSSMGGGFIVSFTALIKNLKTKVPMPPF